MELKRLLESKGQTFHPRHYQVQSISLIFLSHSVRYTSHPGLCVSHEVLTVDDKNLHSDRSHHGIRTFDSLREPTQVSK